MKQIEVTLEDVQNSNDWNDYKNCPLAVAFRRQFPEVDFTQAGVISIYKAREEEGRKTYFSVARLERGFHWDHVSHITEDKPWISRITFDPAALEEGYAGRYIHDFPTE